MCGVGTSSEHKRMRVRESGHSSMSRLPCSTYKCALVREYV